MNDKRLELHEILCGIINITEPDGDRHTYFDPPMELKMNYPAIRYKRTRIDKVYANNIAYMCRTPYELIVISKNSNDEYVTKLLELPYCSYVRQYTFNGLRHDVLNIYH